jgi:hypothetical protein
VQASAAPDEGRREAPGQADQEVSEDEGRERRGGRGRGGGRSGGGGRRRRRGHGGRMRARRKGEREVKVGGMEGGRALEHWKTVGLRRQGLVRWTCTVKGVDDGGAPALQTPHFGNARQNDWDAGELGHFSISAKKKHQTTQLQHYFKTILLMKPRLGPNRQRKWLISLSSDDMKPDDDG